MSPAHYRHIVLFAFHPTASDDELRRLSDDFAQLPSQISDIRAFERGFNISTEQLDQGFTHAFLLTFDDSAACDRYRNHPAHLAFVERLKPVLAKVLVVDYLSA